MTYPWNDGRRTKYNSRVTDYAGSKRHSAAEAQRQSQLEALQESGKISNLQCQVKYPFVVNGLNCGSYIADFTYTENGQFVVEDVKGATKGEAWDRFLDKRALVKALYGHTIKIYRNGKWITPNTHKGTPVKGAGA